MAAGTALKHPGVDGVFVAKTDAQVDLLTSRGWKVAAKSEQPDPEATVPQSAATKAK